MTDQTIAAPTDAARAELAPTGVLRAGINLGNFLLVTDSSDRNHPKGVAPDMAAAIADRLGVPVHYVPFDTPGGLADAAATDTWDIGLIGRARTCREDRLYRGVCGDPGDLSGPSGIGISAC